MRICYVNGSFVPENEAQVSIFDRGFLFSDGVYEVSLVINGKLIDNEGHLARLENSCKKLAIKMPLSSHNIVDLQQQLIAKNNLKTGSIYLQITRGSDGDRGFLYSENIEPSLIMFTQENDLTDNTKANKGVSIMTVPETRWAHRDIKAIGLLGAVLAKKIAKDNGFDDAWFVENGFITEGSSNNVFIIKDKQLITKAANTQILNGITRQATLAIAQKHDLTIVERNFTVEEAKSAEEAFITSATMLIMPVISIDNVEVGYDGNKGKPGKITKDLRIQYIEMAMSIK